MAANKAACKLAGVKSLTNADADAALLAYANAHLKASTSSDLAASDLVGSWSSGERYQALLEHAAPKTYAKFKKQLRAAANKSPAHVHKVRRVLGDCRSRCARTRCWVTCSQRWVPQRPQRRVHWQPATSASTGRSCRHCSAPSRLLRATIPNEARDSRAPAPRDFQVA
jgi:hypothetical protein